MWLAQNGMADPNNAGAGAYAYMQLMGLVSLGWMWLKMAGAAAKLLADGGEDRAFHEAKLATARFFADARTGRGQRAARARSRPAPTASWRCRSRRSELARACRRLVDVPGPEHR